MMNIQYGVSEDIGLRSHMEDEHRIYTFEEIPLFSAEIYDGHGGIRPARIAAKMLTPAFAHALKREAKKPKINRRDWAGLLRDAYLEVDSCIVGQKLESGTCAVELYISGENFMAANVGDSRVIMGLGGGSMVLTKDHKPDIPAERDRIESLGGRVVVFGVPRVQGILAISRALGDACLKPYVSPEPRIIEGILGRENDRAIIACDGVWDVLSPDSVISIARRSSEDPKEIADMIIQSAKDAGSLDNMTVVVLNLKDYTARLDHERMKLTGVYDRA